MGSNCEATKARNKARATAFSYLVDKGLWVVGVDYFSKEEFLTPSTPFDGRWVILPLLSDRNIKRILKRS